MARNPLSLLASVRDLAFPSVETGFLYQGTGTLSDLKFGCAVAGVKPGAAHENSRNHGSYKLDTTLQL
jgi:hypothetical protein